VWLGSARCTHLQSRRHFHRKRLDLLIQLFLLSLNEVEVLLELLTLAHSELVRRHGQVNPRHLSLQLTDSVCLARA
jgi:hypothetical protein